MITTELQSNVRLHLLEKARAMRDSGKMLQARWLVNMANEIKERIEGIEEHYPPQRTGEQEASTSVGYSRRGE